TAHRVHDGAVLPADAILRHSGAAVAATFDLLARAFRFGLCVGHGVKGIDGHRTCHRAAVRPHVRIQFLARDVPDPAILLFRSRGDVGRAARLFAVTATNDGRFLGRHQSVDLSAQPSRDDYSLFTVEPMAELPGP